MIKFYFQADGKIFDNEKNLPVGMLPTFETVPFRFAVDRDSNSLFIQDGSFSKLISSGHKDAWTRLNGVLLALADEGVTFPKVIHDSPKHETKRSLSDFKDLWSSIKDFITELGVHPDGITNIEIKETWDKDGEHAVHHDGEHLNVNTFKFINEAGDIDVGKLCDGISEHVLNNPSLLADIPERHADKHGYEGMVAVQTGGKTRVFKPKDPEALDEFSMRAKGMLGNYSGPVVVFSIHKDKKMVRLHNTMPSALAKTPVAKDLMSGIVGAAARLCGCPERDILMTFDPFLNAPFWGSVRKYGPLWSFLKIAANSGGLLEDVKTLEIPLGFSDRLAIPVMTAEREPAELRKFRILKGIEAEYPYIATDNRTMRLGTKLRDMAISYMELTGHKLKKPQDQDVASLMSDLKEQGMQNGDILDFLSPTTDLARRFVIRKTLIASKDSKIVKTAGMGLGLEINDWWQYGLQEELDRSQHVNDGMDKGRFNLKKHKNKGTKNKSLTELLSQSHDKEASAQKTTEQLLRETRI